jgi:putative two-component system response regulator
VALHLELKAFKDDRHEAAASAFEDDGAILAMAALAEPHEPHIGKHLLRTQRLVAALAAELQFHERFRAVLTPHNMALIVKAAPLHDIGKVQVDQAILRKPGRLTVEEFAAMQAHTTGGRDALEAVARTLGGATPFLRFAGEIAWSHQEKWDGSGYPQGLAGDAIPVAARLMAVADVYDALVTARSYRPAFTHETAVELIRQGRGEHFDPDVADAVLVVEERFRAIAAELADAA